MSDTCVPGESEPIFVCLYCDGILIDDPNQGIGWMICSECDEPYPLFSRIKLGKPKNKDNPPLDTEAK